MFRPDPVWLPPLSRAFAGLDVTGRCRDCVGSSIYKPMNLSDHEREVLSGIVHRLKTQWNAREVLLYGSAARGELDESSDIDLLAIMPVADWETKKQICDLCFEAELDIGRIISVHCVSEEALKNTPIRSSPFIQNVRREGVPQ